MFIINLFPLVHGDLCSCRKTIQKCQISSTRRQVDVAGGSGPTRLGRPTHLVLLGAPWSPATSLIHPKAKKHNCKPSPPLIPSRCMIRGQKEASHGLLTHHPVCQVLKWTNGVHTHTLPYPKGPHTKGGGPTQQWGAGWRPTYASRHPSITPPPLLWAHVRKHTWEQSYALIYGGSRLV